MRGASTNEAQKIAHAEAEAEIEVGVALEEYSFNIVQRDCPYLLDYYRAIVMQSQLDELHTHFNIPRTILMGSQGEMSHLEEVGRS